MATQYWVGADSSWNTAANWASTSGGSDSTGPPASGDAVIFDGGDVTNCTLDVGAQTIASIDVQSGYTGTLDFADSAYAFAVTGNATFACTGTVDWGDADITIGGNYTTNTATFIVGSGSHTLTGTTKTWTPKNSGAAIENSVVVSGTYSTAASIAYPHINVGLTIDAGGKLTLNSTLLALLKFAAVSSLEINGELDFNGSNAGGFAECYRTDVFGTGTVSNTSGLGGFRIYDFSSSVGGLSFPLPVTLQFSNAIPITGNVVFDDLTITANTELSNTGNYDIEIGGSLVMETGATWTKGDGTITLAPPVSTTKTYNFNGETIEKLVINGAGTAELTGTFTTDSLTCTSGTLDVNAQNITVTPGNMTVAANCSVIE